MEAIVKFYILWKLVIRNIYGLEEKKQQNNKNIIKGWQLHAFSP